jgi:hypothetical protein
MAGENDPLRDGLKAVAGSLRQAADEDGDKTVVLQKPAASSLQSALKNADAAMSRNAPEQAATAITNRAPRQSVSPPAAPKTQMVRGQQKPKRTDFHQDPVVGWLVVIGGPGLGAFRPIYEGNNTVGRAPGQRIPIDFGDDAISAEEQAFLRYDAADRQFLLVPNLAKTNVISVNDAKPTAAVQLSAMDVITMGRTQLVFVPFCGNDFDWSELTELKE